MSVKRAMALNLETFPAGRISTIRADLDPNTVITPGLPDREIGRWDRGIGRLTGHLGRTRVILWDGHWPIHMRSRAKHIQTWLGS